MDFPDLTETADLSMARDSSQQKPVPRSAGGAAMASTHNAADCDMKDVSLLDYLCKDLRPTFILNTETHHIALQNEPLENYLLAHRIDKDAFRAWALSITSNSPATTLYFGGRAWNTTNLDKWTIVSGCRHDHAALALPVGAPLPPGRTCIQPSTHHLAPFRNYTRSGSGSDSDTAFDPPSIPRRVSMSPSLTSTSWRSVSEDGAAIAARTRSSLDWTKFVHSSGLSPHIQMVQNFRWDLTPVGHMSTWPDSLRQLVLAIMSNSDPRVVMWGEERRMIYNEASALLFGENSSLAMGAKAEEIWAESWRDLVHIVRRAEREGKSTKVAKMPLAMRRHGYLEETFWTLQMIPIIGPQGQVLGVLDEFCEITEQLVSERRREAAVKISHMISHVNNLKELCFEFLEGLESCHEDVPFAVLYTSLLGSDRDVKPRQFHLEGSVGIAATGLPSLIDLAAPNTAQHALVDPCNTVLRTGEHVLLSAADGSLPPEFAITIPGRALGEKIKDVFVLPIKNISESGDVVSFLILATSPRRPRDAHSVEFAHCLRDIFIKSTSAIVLPEEQRRTRQRFEEIETSLAQQLRATTLEAEKIEARFAQMAQSAPVAMYAIRTNHETIFYNEAYLSITGITREEVLDIHRDPADAIHPEDRERVMEAWMNCLEDKLPFTCEYRVCKSRIHTDPTTGEEILGDCWVFTNATPELDENGEIDHIRGWLLDISDRKAHEQLRVKKVHNEKAEQRFARLAETAPLGMYLLHVDGRPIYLNDSYFNLLGFTRSDFEEAESRGLGWADRIHDEDMQSVAEAWTSLIQDGVPLNLEYRIKKPWKAYDTATGTEMNGETWLQGTAVLEMDEEGVPLAVQGFVTDISLKKFSERLLTERLNDALETKQQADRFIDMVSHEIRNPLSAILQSADGVLTCLESGGPLNQATTLTSEATETVVDSAQTIILCAQHQKRIVDDILTLSKLDSNLLVISPDRTSIPSLLEKTIKMYEAELARSDVSARLILEKSYIQLAVDEVMLDSSRLLQVVINLFTNALKFTQYSERRELKMHLGASVTQPTCDRFGTAFIEARPNRPDHTSSPEWGNGEELYLQVAVEDSGKGLAEDELKLLFQRFQQASPKTYKQYGGSGLGLFISRELSELQGGQIGVYSEAGKGSTFSFYVKARRCAPDVATPPPSDWKPTTPTLNSSPVTYARADSIGSADGVTLEMLKAGESSRASSVKRASVSSASRATKPYLGPLHVLVVEDNLVNQRVMAQQLRRLGCTVHVANHGVEALEFLQRTTFWNQTDRVHSQHLSPDSASTGSDCIPLSVVLMDLEMPVLGGLGCIKQIRELQESGKLKSHVPVIAVTANARSEQIAIAIDHGMDSVITKPFRIPELVPQMQSLVSRVKAAVE